MNVTAVERQSKMYAADIIPRIEVVNNDTRLLVDNFHRNSHVLYHGERTRIVTRLVNAGKTDIGEVWVIMGRYDRATVILPNSLESTGMW